MDIVKPAHYDIWVVSSSWNGSSSSLALLEQQRPLLMKRITSWFGDAVSSMKSDTWYIHARILHNED